MPIFVKFGYFTLCFCYCLAYPMIPKINPKGPTVTNNAVNCLMSIANNFFAKTPGLVVITQSFNMTPPGEDIKRLFMEAIHATSKWTIMVVGNDNEPDTTQKQDKNEAVLDFSYLFADKADYYVIIVDSVAIFRQKLLELVHLDSWNPRAKMVVLCSTYYESQTYLQTQSEQILKYLWSHYALYSVVLLQDVKTRATFQLFTWNPYDPPKRCGDFGENATGTTELYGFCYNGKLEKKTDLFANKLPSDMQLCSLKVLSMVAPPFINKPNSSSPGMEFQLLETIAETLNVKLVVDINSTARGEKEKNGKWSGMIRKLINREGDLAIGALFSDNDVHVDFEGSVSYLENSYTWVVPRALPKPRWLASVSVFQIDTWLYSLITYLMCIIIWYILAKLSNESLYHRSFDHCIINCYLIVVGNVAYSRPIHHTLRVFFIFLCLYTVILVTAYQTNLVGVLTHPQYERQIDSLEEVLDSGVSVGGIVELRDVFDDSDEELYAIVGKRYIEVTDSEDALQQLITYRNFSLLVSRLYLDDMSAHKASFTDSYGKPNYHTLANVLSIPVEIVSLKGYPFMDIINKLINLFKSNGLWSKWVKDYNVENKKKAAYIKKKFAQANKEDEAGNVKLTLEHLQSGYAILVLGYVIGVLAFAVERLTITATFVNTRTKVVSSLRNVMVRWKQRRKDKP